MCRTARSTEVAPTAITIAEIQDLLLGAAIKGTDLLVFIQSLVSRLFAAELPLERVSLHVGT